MVLSLEIMPLEPKAPEPAAPKTIVVRYGYLKLIGEFPSGVTTKVGCGSKLVLRTLRGTEIGEMLTTVCGNGGCNKSITRDKMLEYIRNSGGRSFPFSDSGRVLRVATAQDMAVQKRLDDTRSDYLSKARELVARHKVAMKIVEVEQLLGQERIIFYFISEHRVDFRMLVRDMAHEFHARIELTQVGARDEARLVADYEKCGQHCCCKQFLKVLTPISMRSAKIQKGTLDPAKISGRCGRLMCCLRYEDQTYEDLRKRLPNRNTRVRTEKGEAWVLEGQILTQLVMLQFDDGERTAVPMEEILAFNLPKPKFPNGRTMQTAFDTMPEEPRTPGQEKGPPAGHAARRANAAGTAEKPGGPVRPPSAAAAASQAGVPPQQRTRPGPNNPVGANPADRSAGPTRTAGQPGQNRQLAHFAPPNQAIQPVRRDLVKPIPPAPMPPDDQRSQPEIPPTPAPKNPGSAVSSNQPASDQTPASNAPDLPESKQ
jgi:cell fate regulator YaaT (PSP1 superfamily)